MLKISPCSSHIASCEEKASLLIIILPEDCLGVISCIHWSKPRFTCCPVQYLDISQDGVISGLKNHRLVEQTRLEVGSKDHLVLSSEKI